MPTNHLVRYFKLFSKVLFAKLITYIKQYFFKCCFYVLQNNPIKARFSNNNKKHS